MKIIARFFALSLSLALITGCVSIKIDESNVFAPPKRDGATAASVAELNTRWASNLAPRQESGVLTATPIANDGLLMTFLRPSAATGKLAPPMVVRHGFLGQGEARIAWSLFTGVDDKGVERGADRPLVVHCAGNAGDRYNIGVPYARKAMPWADVFVFDYPGYGDTAGPASAAKFEAASAQVVSHILEISKDRKLVFWGHSLGGFVCARLATSTQGADGLVLETTAPNVQAVAKAWTPWFARPFVRAQIADSLASYDVVADASRVSGPILVLGAKNDNQLSVTLARALSEGLSSRGAAITYHEFANAGHNDVPDQPDFPTIVTTFFQTVESPK